MLGLKLSSTCLSAQSMIFCDAVYMFFKRILSQGVFKDHTNRLDYVSAAGKLGSKSLDLLVQTSTLKSVCVLIGNTTAPNRVIGKGNKHERQNIQRHLGG